MPPLPLPLGRKLGKMATVAFAFAPQFKAFASAASLLCVRLFFRVTRPTNKVRPVRRARGLGRCEL